MIPLQVTAARAWIGTPYRHQESLRDSGCDCLGLLRGVWRELLGEEPEVVPPYSPDWSEPQGDEALLRAAARHMLQRPSGGEGAGDVLLFRMRAGSVAKHLGIATGTGPGAGFVHAYPGHGVVESALTEPWRRRIAARFVFPQRS